MREQVAPHIVRVTADDGRYYVINHGGSEYTLPSVTTVLHAIAKPALLRWSERQGRDGAILVATQLYTDLIKTGGSALSPTEFATTVRARLPKQRASERALAKASEIGSYVHALVEHEMRQRLGVASQRPKTLKIAEHAQAADRAFSAWQKWAATVQLKPLAIEYPVYSLARRRVAGTLDLLAEVEGTRKVLDWKTGKSIYGEAFLQNAVYQDALEEMGEAPVVGGVIVRLPKDVHDPEPEVAYVPDRAELLRAFDGLREFFDWWQADEQRSKAAFVSRISGTYRGSRSTQAA